MRLCIRDDSKGKMSTSVTHYNSDSMNGFQTTEIMKGDYYRSGEVRKTAMESGPVGVESGFERRQEYYPKRRRSEETIRPSLIFPPVDPTPTTTPDPGSFRSGLVPRCHTL